MLDDPSPSFSATDPVTIPGAAGNSSGNRTKKGTSKSPPKKDVDALTGRVISKMFSASPSESPPSSRRSSTASYSSTDFRDSFSSTDCSLSDGRRSRKGSIDREVVSLLDEDYDEKGDRSDVTTPREADAPPPNEDVEFRPVDRKIKSPSPSILDERGSPFAGYDVDRLPFIRTVTFNFKEVQTYFQNRFRLASPAGFFLKMPKGAETHAHNTGSIPVKQLLIWAERGDLYFHKDTFKAAVSSTEKKDFIAFSKMDKTLINSLTATLCVKGRHPDGLTETDRFFDACTRGEKILELAKVSLWERVQVIAEKDAKEKVLYREDMIELLPDDDELEVLKNLLEKDERFNFDELENYFQTIVSSSNFDNYSRRSLNEIKKCYENVANIVEAPLSIESEEQKVVYHFITEIDRVKKSIVEFFIGAVCAFELAKRDPRHIVGVNVVGREDHYTADLNFDNQFRILEWLKNRYKEVKFSIHCGETRLDTETSDVGQRMLTVLEKLKPERMGHAFALGDLEQDVRDKIIAVARQNKTTFEGCPSSSLFFFKNRMNPLFQDLSHSGLQISINGDDVGVLDSSLSEQYTLIHENCHKTNMSGSTERHTYRRFMHWNRMGLESAFLPGDSLYKTEKLSGYFQIRQEFVGISEMNLSSEAIDILNKNEKARLQFHLERRVLEFEQTICREIIAEERQRREFSPVANGPYSKDRI